MLLVMSEASDPVDILWKNIGGVRGIYIFRKYFFNIIGLLLIFFLSTPAAIYSSLKMLEMFKFLNFDYTISGDTFWGSLLITLLPPLVIIFINNILLLMIDYSAFYEKRITHSKYQFSIFNKAYIYLALNMLIIPAVTLSSYSSLIEVAKKNNYNVLQILAQFYSQNSGVFFVSMLIQNACLSLCTNLVRMGEIGNAFFSPWLAHYRRKFFHDSQAWRRKEGMVFLYGFYYSQHLIIVTIVLIFSTTVPMISAAGLLFFGLRHIIDSFNLLTIYRKEIDSVSNLFRKVLLYFQFGLIMLQLCMIAFLYVNF